MLIRRLVFLCLFIFIVCLFLCTSSFTLLLVLFSCRLLCGTSFRNRLPSNFNVLISHYLLFNVFYSLRTVFLHQHGRSINISVSVSASHTRLTTLVYVRCGRPTLFVYYGFEGNLRTTRTRLNQHLVTLSRLRYSNY